MRRALRVAALAVAGGFVVLGPAAASGAPKLAACSEDQIPTATTAALGGGKAVTGVVAAWTWGTSPCLLNARLTLTVKHFTQRVSSGGGIRTIKGNPGAVHVHAVLQPGSVFVAAWRWRNWCGRRGRFLLQPSFNQWPYLAVPSNAFRAPACASRTARSTLARARVRLRTCAAGDLHVTPGVDQGFMQSLIVGVSISLRAHRSACLLRATKLDFALQRQAGGAWTTLQQIAGNPGNRTIGALLVPGSQDAETFWAWRNWCGGTGTFRTLARVDGRAATGAVFTDTPFCQDSGSPSTLVPSFGHS